MSKKMKAYNHDTNHTRLAILETIAEQTSQTLARLEKKIDKLDDKIENYRSETRAEINDVKKELIDVRKDNFSHFKWMMGLIISIFLIPYVPQFFTYVSKIFSG